MASAAAAPALRLRHGPVDVAPVLIAFLAARCGVTRPGEIGAVDGKAGDHLRQRLAQRVQGEIARAPVGLRDAREPVREHGELARERGAHDEELRLARDLGEFRHRPRRTRGRRGRSSASRGVDEEAVHDVREAVAGGAVNGPASGHALVAGGDLLGDQVERPPRAACGGFADGRVALLQAAEIAGRVVQPVGVVDAQAVHAPLREQLEDQAMGGLEHRLVLHAQRGELVDIEEAAVVDLVGRDAPVRQAIRLRLEQLVQRVEARGLPGRAVELARGRVDAGRDRRVSRGKRGEAAPCALPCRGCARRACRPRSRCAAASRRTRSPDSASSLRAPGAQACSSARSRITAVAHRIDGKAVLR